MSREKRASLLTLVYAIVATVIGVAMALFTYI